MADHITVQQLHEALIPKAHPKLLGGEKGLGNRLSSAELNRPGLALTGYLEYFQNHRVQIIGNTETSYLAQLSAEEAEKRVREVFEHHIPCLFVTAGNDVPPAALALAEETSTPVFSTELPTTRFSLHVLGMLEARLAPETHVHGVLVDVHGIGTLLMGPSGVGKSECALELVERGHRLVADDVVVVRRLGKNHLVGCATEILGFHMEVRGLGVVDIRSLFGINAIALEKEILLIVQLERWDESKKYDRMGLEERTHAIFDLEVPEYVIPVRPGRNIAMLVEAAALTQRQRNQGINPAEAFNRSLISRMGSPRKSP